MNNLASITKAINAHRRDLREKYKITQIGIFGSYSRGEEKKGSDVDILVEFDGSVSLLWLVKAENYLSGILSRKVDLVPKEDVRIELKDRILSEVIYI